MKFTSRLALSSTVILLLAACSSNPEARRQAKQDFDYLDAPALEAMRVPEGMNMPVYSDYRIPEGQFQGGTGPEVDIRSPVQVLELIPGARTQVDADGTVTVWLVSEENLEKVWDVFKRAVTRSGVDVRRREPGLIETNWIRWTQEGDDEAGISSRYLIRMVMDGRRFGFMVKPLEFKKEGFDALPADQLTRQRYSAIMTNLITSRYDQEMREEAQRLAQQQIKRIPISMGQDRSGLPVIIARASYDVFWERIPSLLNKSGFTLEGRNRSQGEIDVRFKPADDEFWQELGVKPIRLGSRTYKVQLGDLGNRTSINVTDGNGKPVAEQDLESLALAFAAFVERSAE
ncbi:outer membrane protein assembly factor BamC [Thaumasiovibrio subtropicus]|uniref:outer membrane protein assembly factor BamC n=1 Tax=Thaumasiovibrio subtropicus TaxID=1891207 RepID=UPI000B355017|nr:outer membrane protein assembly factor BamC [Thaumasiovibrio subtropicus]